MKLTEEVLLNLGFEKVIVSAEESGDEEYNYFIYEFSDENDLSLISCENDECKEPGVYTVDLFNYTGHVFCETKEDVLNAIKILKKNNFK